MGIISLLCLTVAEAWEDRLDVALSLLVEGIQ